MQEGENQTEVVPHNRSNRTGLVLAGGLLLKSQFYLLSAVCVS